MVLPLPPLTQITALPPEQQRSHSHSCLPPEPRCSMFVSGGSGLPGMIYQVVSPARQFLCGSCEKLVVAAGPLRLTVSYSQSRPSKCRSLPRSGPKHKTESCFPGKLTVWKIEAGTGITRSFEGRPSAVGITVVVVLLYWRRSPISG